MTPASERLLLWSPRILGTGLAMFLGLFALDVFGHDLPVSREAFEFAIHILPALLLLALVAVSWRHPWVGGIGFIALAAVYSAMTWRRLDWVLVIASPLLLVGVLFLWSWRSSRRA